MRRNQFLSKLALILVITQLSGCAHIGLELYGRLKGPPSTDEVRKSFAQSMNVAPEKITISNIKERKGNGNLLAGSGSKDYTFDAAISGKTKNCSLTKLSNDEIYFTGCTVKDAALNNW